MGGSNSTRTNLNTSKVDVALPQSQIGWGSNKALQGWCLLGVEKWKQRLRKGFVAVSCWKKAVTEAEEREGWNGLLRRRKGLWQTQKREQGQKGEQSRKQRKTKKGLMQATIWSHSPGWHGKAFSGDEESTRKRRVNERRQQDTSFQQQDTSFPQFSSHLSSFKYASSTHPSVVFVSFHIPCPTPTQSAHMTTVRPLICTRALRHCLLFWSVLITSECWASSLWESSFFLHGANAQ